MKYRIVGFVSAFLLLANALGLNAQTPAPAAPAIVVTVPDISCPSCAKKLTKELMKVSGVAQVQANIEDKTLTIRPNNGATPSPRLLWEAIERAGYQPSRLDAPGGSFTAKPQA